MYIIIAQRKGEFGMSKNKESYFSAEKVDSSYIKKNGKRNVSPLKKIISFALALSLISSSGVAISKLYKEKNNDFDISGITFGTSNTGLEKDNDYYYNIYENYRESLGGDEFVNELKDVYDTGIKYVSELYGELGLENSVQCYFLFNYLDDKGYLSVDNSEIKRQYNSNNDSHYLDLYLDGIEGLDLISKKSVCRHESAFYSDSINEYGIKAYPVSCFMGETGKEYNIKNSNHSVVISEDLGGIVLDTLNDSIYDKTSTTYVDSEPYVYFSYNSNSFLYMIPDDSSYERLNVICSKLDKGEVEEVKSLITSDKESLSSIYLEEQKKIVDNKIKDHYSDIEKFKDKYELNVKEKLPQIKR